MSDIRVFTATPPGSGDFAADLFASDLTDDGYEKGDRVRPHQEPGNGAIVLAHYQAHNSHDEYEIVWRREDRTDNQERGSWFEIRTPGGFCTECGTTRRLGVTGPSSWGEVLGLDDEEPYGLGQVVLWPGGKNAFWW